MPRWLRSIPSHGVPESFIFELVRAPPKEDLQNKVWESDVIKEYWCVGGWLIHLDATYLVHVRGEEKADCRMEKDMVVN